MQEATEALAATNDQRTSVPVGIGIASFPDDADSGQKLVGAAVTPAPVFTGVHSSRGPASGVPGFRRSPD